MNPKALARVRRKYEAHITRRAYELRDITVELHVTAPRGGLNLNYFKEPRSAGGEQPAVEFGTLTNTIANSVTINGLEASVVVNRPWLEYGYYKGAVRVAPRPMGRMAISRLKRGS